MALLSRPLPGMLLMTFKLAGGHLDPVDHHLPAGGDLGQHELWHSHGTGHGG